MGFRHFTLIAGMLFASHAMAIVISPVHSKSPDCDGRATSFQANVQDLQSIDLSELIHKTALEKKDRRVGLNEFKPETLPPVSKREELLLQKTVGRCDCAFLGDKQKTPETIHSSCFVAGNRQTHAELHFNAHLIRPYFLPDGTQRPGKLKCAFANKAGDARIEFALVKGTFRAGSMDPNDDLNDKVVVKLSRPIPGGAELPIVDGNSVITENMPLYFFSAEQERMKVEVDANQPVAQEVKVVRVYRNDAGEVVGFLTTGSATMHSSGSVYMTRDSQGGLAAVGMIQGASKADRDGQSLYKTDANGNVLLDQNGNPRLNNANFAIPMKQEFTVEDKQMAEGLSSAPSATKGL